MPAGTVRISDIIVPQIFSPYVQQQTEEKSRIIQSGAVAMNQKYAGLLQGGGLTFNEPSFKDVENDADNVSSDDPGVTSSPNKLGTTVEKQVRLSRNNSWSTMDLATALAGADPARAIAERVGAYWARRLQAATVATLRGVFADNAAAPVGSEHVQNDLTFNVSGASFVEGVTNFSTEAFIDATATMGDSMEDLTLAMVHSVVYARMLKNNLIDFVPDSTGTTKIATYLGREIIVDDGMPVTGGVYETWLFGRGAVQMAQGMPLVPTETFRSPSSGNGSGQDTLYNRTEWIIHPVGHAYVGTAANGGPSNLATTHNLAHADSWQRAFAERKQIKIGRLITREF